MAYLLSYTDAATGAEYPATYAMIRSVNLVKPNKQLNVTLGLFATQAARTGGLRPFTEQNFLFVDNASAAGMGFTSNFSAVPIAPPSPLAAPVNADDILLGQIYIALRQHPAAQALLASATNT